GETDTAGRSQRIDGRDGSPRGRCRREESEGEDRPPVRADERERQRQEARRGERNQNTDRLLLPRKTDGSHPGQEERGAGHGGSPRRWHPPRRRRQIPGDEQNDRRQPGKGVVRQLRPSERKENQAPAGPGLESPLPATRPGKA